jgi:hypothetical protein
MALRDLTKALSPAAIVTDGRVIQHQRVSSDVPALETGTPHAGPDPLDDQVAFELGDGADDHDDGAAQGTARVDLLTEADELDVEPVELIEPVEEVLLRPVSGLIDSKCFSRRPVMRSGSESASASSC